MFPERGPLVLGLTIVAAAAAGCAVLGWQVPLVAICVSGLPVLFAAYLHQTRAGDVLPRRPLTAAVALALALGIGWALLFGPITADGYRAALGGRVDAAQVLLYGVAIPMTYGLALIAPATLARAMCHGPPATGLAIGAAGALVVNATATATLLAPQVTTGLTVTRPPAGSLLAEAFVEGLAWPLVSATVGGLFGIALWRRHRGWPVSIPAASSAALVFTAAMGIVDVAPLTLGRYVALQSLITVVAILAMRIVMAKVIDGESQTSRVTPQRSATYRGVVGRAVAGVGAAVAIAVAVAAAVTPGPATYACPPDCGGPPTGNPVETNPRFSGDNGAFSVAYPGKGTAYDVTFDPPGINGVQMRYLAGDTGLMTFFGERAGGRKAKQVVSDVLGSRYPSASVSYEMPNASLGYEPGYGVVADVFSRQTSSFHDRLRVIVMAAVRHDYALIATATGPFHQFSQEYGPGHPSAANLEVAMDMGKYVNSFRWYGDRYARPS